jgi:SEC-C motif-containing protein
MRSRYTAFVLEDEAHLLASWHPVTRPGSVAVGVQEWLGLQVLDAVGGGPDDETGVVEFEATFRDADGELRLLHERSTFLRDGGRWLYVGPEDASVD